MRMLSLLGSLTKGEVWSVAVVRCLVTHQPDLAF